MDHDPPNHVALQRLLPHLRGEARGSWRLTHKAAAQAVYEDSNALTASRTRATVRLSTLPTNLLTKCSRLRALDISWTKVADLSPLQLCPSLFQLTCIGMPSLTSLAGVPSWVQQLDISQSPVSDLSPLLGCTALQQLTCKDCTSITHLSGLPPTLHLLDISGTRTTDLTPLQHCTALHHFTADRVLAFFFAATADGDHAASTLVHLTALQQLSIRHTCIQPQQLAMGLQHLTRLQRLDLQWGTEKAAGGAAVALNHFNMIHQLPLPSVRDTAAAPSLAPALQQLPGLKALALRGIRLDLLDAQALAPALMRLTALKRLSLSGSNSNSIGAGVAQVLAPALGQLTALQQLELGSSSMCPDSAQSLAPALEQLTALHTLGMSFSVTPEATQALAAALLQLKQLRVLKLTRSDAGVLGRLMQLEGGPAPHGAGAGRRQLPGAQLGWGPSADPWLACVETLAVAIQQLSSLQHLALLSFNQLSGPLAPALHHLPQLRQLQLCGCRGGRRRSIAMDTEDAEALALALQQLTGLHRLELSDTALCTGGMVTLAPTLQLLTGLQQLGLGRNSIREQGAAALAPALLHLTGLQELGLGGNDLGHAGLLALLPALCRLGALHSLDLQDNQLTDTSVMYLLHVVEELGGLRALGLRGNQLRYVAREDRVVEFQRQRPWLELGL